MNEKHQSIALELARLAIATYLESRTVIESPPEDPFVTPTGVFVSLKAGKELRGCIGYAEPRYPLGDAIIRAGILAATDDPRFEPVTREDLDLIRIEISVLSSYEEIIDPLEVQVGVHGILVTTGGARGLLLPQVPVEHRWDREEFLIYGCRKAGLSDNAWKLPNTKIYVFTAEVFGEQR